MFRLTREEWQFLRSQIVTSSWGGHRYPPYAFTRNGANMVSAILKSPIAIQRSIQIMRAFSALEESLSKRNKKLTQSPDILKKLSTHSRAIMQLFQESKINRKGVQKVEKIQREMIELLQQMVIASIGKGE